MAQARERSFREALTQLKDDFAAEAKFRIERQRLPPTKYKEEEVYEIDHSTGEITVTTQVVKGGQLVGMNSLFGQYLKGRREKGRTQKEIRLDILSFIVGRRVGSSEELTRWECSCIIGLLKIAIDPRQRQTQGQQNPEDYWLLSEYGGWFLTECEKAIECGLKSNDFQGARDTPAPSPEPAKRPNWTAGVSGLRWGAKRGG